MPCVWHIFQASTTFEKGGNIRLKKWNWERFQCGTLIGVNRWAYVNWIFTQTLVRASSSETFGGRMLETSPNFVSSKSPAFRGSCFKMRKTIVQSRKCYMILANPASNLDLRSSSKDFFSYRHPKWRLIAGSVIPKDCTCTPWSLISLTLKMFKTQQNGPLSHLLLVPGLCASRKKTSQWGTLKPKQKDELEEG